MTGLLILLATDLWYLRDSTLKNGRAMARSHATVLKDEMVRVLSTTEKTLDAVRAAYGVARQDTRGGVDISGMLKAQLTHQPDLNGLWIADKYGRIQYDTHATPEPINIADRDFFIAHQQQGSPALYVGVSVVSRRTAQWQLSVSSALRDAQGNFEGVVVASISPEHLIGLWESVAMGDGGVVGLWNASGKLLLGAPFDAGSNLGADMSHVLGFDSQSLHSVAGDFTSESAVDGVVREYAFRRFPHGGGLMMVVGLAQAQLLEPWWRAVRFTLTMASILIVVGGVALTFLHANIVRRRVAERAAILHSKALDAITQGVVITTAQGDVLAINRAFESITGFCLQELEGRSVEVLHGVGSSADAGAGWRQAIDQRAAADFQALSYRKNGQSFWSEWSIAPVVEEGGLPHFVGVLRDVTERQTLLRDMELAQRIIQQGREGMTITDAAGSIQRVNQAFTSITGYSEAEVLGKNPRILTSGLQSKAFYETMWQAILQEGCWSGEIYNRRKDGTVYPEWLTISVLRDQQGEICNFVGNFSDLSQIRAAESREYRLAHIDPLTGLPNHSVLQDRTANAISMAQRSRDPLCLMCLGIDDFRMINDTYGQDVGDKLLVEVARRLLGAVREQDTVSHSTGRKFTLLLPTTDSDGAAHLAKDLLWKLAQEHALGGQSFHLTASIGIACCPENGTDYEALAQCAEIAMHRAQVEGCDTFRFYSESMYDEVKDREQLTKGLRAAVGNGELQVLYQPLADMQEGNLCGMEALVRWHHPQRGSMSPSLFIPLAEETGIIRTIGMWVFQQVCSDIRRWQDSGLTVPKVAVNVSAVQLQDPGFLRSLQAAMDASQLSPQNLFLEVTESALIEDVQNCEQILGSLKRMGFGLSLDDFGTGYSSLAYLKRYPFDKVKIDQSFVHEIDSSKVDAVIVNVIIGMAHGLGLKVVAEGVETEAQCEFMRNSVCDEIQGYLYSRPVDCEAMASLLGADHKLPSHLLRFRPPQRALLLVDDEPNVVSSLKRLFRRDGYTIFTANSGADGLALLAQEKVDVIISDQRMPNMTGVEFLREAKKRHPDTVRIVLSGYTDLQSITDAINEGAIYRFLTKPWVDEQLREQVSKAFEYTELADKNRQLDIKIRSTNQELVAANRHLEALIEASIKKEHIESVSLAVVREMLKLISIPVIGVDDQQYVMFSNSAANQVFSEMGGLLGCHVQDLHPDLVQWLGSEADGECSGVTLGGKQWTLRWSSMGKSSRSRGMLLSLLPSTQTG